MLFGDDLCTTISTISSAFTELHDDGGDNGVGDNGDDGELHEMKPLVKTEIVEEEFIPDGVPLTLESIDFLTSFERSDGNGETPTVAVVSEGAMEEEAGSDRPKRNKRIKDPDEDLEDKDFTTWARKPKKKPAPGMARRGGRQIRMTRQEKQALSQRERRALMTPEEKEKRKLEKQRKVEEENLPALVSEEDDDKDNETELPSKRPSRKAKLKPTIKDEVISDDENEDVGDGDDEYQVDEEDDEDWRKKKKTTHPKRSSTKATPRAPRSTSGRGRKKKAIAEIGGEEVDEGEMEKKKKPRKNKTSGDSGGDSSAGPSRRKAGGGGGGRKKLSEMTEEEKEAMKAKWRVEARLKRARQRETMTPDQREEYLRKQRDQRREKRAAAKVTLTDEQREEENRKARERKKVRRETMTPEQKQEEAQRRTIRRIERMATMSEDEKKMKMMSNYLRYTARMGRMTDEQIEKERIRRLDWLKRRREQMTQEDVERRRQEKKAYRDNMTPEQRARFLETLRKGYRRRLERLKTDPNKWEEVKTKWKDDRLRRQQKMKEMGENYQRRWKKPASTWKGQVRDVNMDETPEERAERMKESKRLTWRKMKLRKKLEMQKMLESGMSIEEVQSKMETPEQRERRLIRQRIRKAKRTLKTRLEAQGADEEEIKKKLQELEETYQPTLQFRPYKPRTDGWEKIDPNDLAILERESPEKKPSISTPTKAPGTSKGRRGRLPKFLEIEQQQQQQQSTSSATGGEGGAVAAIASRMVAVGDTKILTTTTSYQQAPAPPPPFQPNPFANPPQIGIAYPEPVLSPAAASTCSYVSTAETPEPVHYPIPQHQQHHIHLQQQPHSSNQVYQQYPSYQTQQVPTIYSHQQAPQTHPQTYSLQHILDSITYHETGVVGVPTSTSIITIAPPSAHQSSYQPQQQHHPPDYASSYDNHSPPPSSPPASPHERKPGDYSSASDNFVEFSFNPQAPPSSTSSHKRGRPRKDEPPRPKRSKATSETSNRSGPRGGKKSNKTGVIRDMVCDECGNAYNHSYLREHKIQFHNPNYKNQTCQLCGEKYGVARHWYSHFLKVHTEQPPKDKPHMCDLCGQSFRQKNNLEMHKYYIHGDGQKKENFIRCPVCPEEKLFKKTVSLFAHLKKKHPGYNRGTRDCYRCDKTFPDDKELCLHVKEVHPDSYFPCQFCNACRFTKYGLHFHYSRCTKITKQERDAMRKKEEGFSSLDRVPLPCEFCGRNVAISSLTRHYWEMHNVREEEFKCGDCGKGFRVRAFWAVHMEEKHLKTLEDMREVVRTLNVREREGIVVRNPGGVKGAVPGNTPRKAASQRRIEMGVRRKGRKTGGRKKKEKMVEEEEEVETEEDTGTELSSSEEDGGGKGKKKRRILVIAEEDEEGDGGEEVVVKVSVGGCGDDKKEVKKKKGRRPGPKSKTRRRRLDSTEEDTQEDVPPPSIDSVNVGGGEPELETVTEILYLPFSPEHEAVVKQEVEVTEGEDEEENID